LSKSNFPKNFFESLDEQVIDLVGQSVKRLLEDDPFIDDKDLKSRQFQPTQTACFESQCAARVFEYEDDEQDNEDEDSDEDDIGVSVEGGAEASIDPELIRLLKWDEDEDDDYKEDDDKDLADKRDRKRKRIF